MNSPFMVINEIHTYASLLLKYFNVGVEERLREYGVKISGLQFGLLRMLMAGNLTISELSQRMGMGASTLVRSIDSLEKKGLVERGSDPQDRRRNPISLTRKGMELIQHVPLVTAEDEVFQALFSLGEDSLVLFRDLLREALSQTPEGKFVVETLSAARPHE